MADLALYDHFCRLNNTTDGLYVIPMSVIQSISYAQDRGHPRYHFALGWRQSGVMIMADIRQRFSMVTGDRTNDQFFFVCERQFLVFQDHLQGAFMVRLPSLDPSNIMQKGSVLELATLFLPILVEGFKRIKQHQGRFRDLPGMTQVR
jgi:hypothetical protein